MYQYVKTYIENGAGYIILNDPKKLNALSQPMAAELSEVLEQFRFDPQIRVIVLRGEGGRFCAGGDITSMKKRVDCYAAGIPAPTQTKTNMANFNHLVLYIRQIEKPVVAWIEGACAGGGMSLAMACDFAIAEENTKMSFAFSSIGLAPDMGSSVLLTRRVGPARAADLFMTGRRFTGKEAADMGIITRAVPAEELEENVKKQITALANGPTLSYAEIKMLAADNPHIKEKMDLDIQVQKLRLLKSNYLSEKYEMEDKIIKYYPTTIARTKETIAGLEKDISLAKEHPKPLDDTFVGIEVKGVSYSEKAEGGQKIIDACKEMTSPDPVPLGKYRGFDLELSFDTFEKAYQVKIKGSLSRSVSLGTDAVGNITRIDNAIEKISERLEAKSRELSTLEQQFATAKAEVEKPFDKEEELTEKTNRLNVLNGLLNVDKRENELVDGAPDEGDSVPTPKERAYER